MAKTTPIFIVWIAFILLQDKTNVELKKLCENKDFCNTAMPSEDAKIGKFNHYKKVDKEPFIIYADLQCLKERIDGCRSNSKNSSETKVGENIQLRFSSTISSFKSIEHKEMNTEVKVVWKSFVIF